MRDEALRVLNEAGTIECARPPWTYLRLPPFPQVAMRVMQLSNNENVQMHELSDLIASDAAFASEVLTIANSMAYAPRFPTSSVLQAVAVLGANQLQGMCLTVGVRAYLGKSLHHPLVRHVWRHNLACAMIAEQLAAAGFIDQDAAYTAGILHDIGRLALVVIRPDEYSELLATHQGSPAGILRNETALFGCNHCEAGKQLIVDWKLPPDFDPIVRDHHAERRSDGTWSMAELIKVSCKLADTAGFAAFAGCEVTSFSELRDELPAREQKTFHFELETLVQTVTGRINAVEFL